jgi:hypothetical protein
VALEPRIVTIDQANPELDDMTRRFWWSTNIRSQRRSSPVPKSEASPLADVAGFESVTGKGVIGTIDGQWRSET